MRRYEPLKEAESIPYPSGFTRWYDKIRDEVVDAYWRSAHEGGGLNTEEYALELVQKRITPEIIKFYMKKYGIKKAKDVAYNIANEIEDEIQDR